MAVYEHIETGDRVRPSKGDRYEQLLRRSPLYRLVDAEGDPDLEPEVVVVEPQERLQQQEPEVAEEPAASEEAESAEEPGAGKEPEESKPSRSKRRAAKEDEEPAT